MIEKIKSLEETAKQLEPGKEERKFITAKAFEYAENFLNEINSNLTYNISTQGGHKIDELKIGEDPENISTIFHQLKKEVDTPGINPASGGHLGYIPGGGIYTGAIGDYLAAVTNRYAGIFFASPGAVKIENLLIKWMASLIGYPDEAAGNLCSGGSIGNLIGIVAARDAHNLEPRNFSRSPIYLTEQTHHSVEKSLRIAGLNKCPMRFVPIDTSFKMISGELAKQIETDKQKGLNPWLVIASAGTTDTGAVDPVDEIAKITEPNGLWLHIDAAYGGFFLLCDEGKKVLKGLNKSDSIVIDPHKGLFLSYGSGAVLVKNRRHLLKSNHYTANYMQDAFNDDEELSPADLSPELSKHFRGLRMWLSLKLLGLKPFRAALEEKIYLARYFYENIKNMENFEVGPFPQLSVVIFRYVPLTGNANEFNKRLIEEIQKDGRVFLSSTTINGNFILRAAILSFRTHLDTIDLAIEIIKNKTEKILKTFD